jgi:hypothetical protein
MHLTLMAMDIKDKELIREELMLRVSALPEMNRKIDKSDFESGFEATAGHLMATPAFANKITSILKEILEEKNIVFSSDAERSELKQFLKPAQTELLRRYMQQ